MWDFGSEVDAQICQVAWSHRAKSDCRFFRRNVWVPRCSWVHRLHAHQDESATPVCTGFCDQEISICCKSSGCLWLQSSVHRCVLWVSRRFTWCIYLQMVRFVCWKASGHSSAVQLNPIPHSWRWCISTAVLSAQAHQTQSRNAPLPQAIQQKSVCMQAIDWESV